MKPRKLFFGNSQPSGPKGHRAYAIGDGPAKLIASMTGTKMALRGREAIRE